MSKVERVKELLGLNKKANKEDLKERHREIIEEVEGETENDRVEKKGKSTVLNTPDKDPRKE